MGFRSALKRVNENRATVAGAWIGGTIAICGLIDYNREVTLYPEFTTNKMQQKSNHLGECMESVHNRASNETLDFAMIVSTRNYSEESYYLFKSALAKKVEVRKSLEVGLGREVTDEQVEAAVVKLYLGFAQRMARRALIRNGNFIKWTKATIQDEFIKLVVVPTVAYVAMRFLKNN